MRSRVPSAAAVALLLVGVLYGCSLPGRPITADRIPQPGRASRSVAAPFDATAAAVLATLNEKSVAVESMIVRDYELGYFVTPDVVPGQPARQETPAESLKRCLDAVAKDAEAAKKPLRPEVVLFGRDAKGREATVTIRAAGDGSLVTAHLGALEKAAATALLDGAAARLSSPVGTASVSGTDAS